MINMTEVFSMRIRHTSSDLYDLDIELMNSDHTEIIVGSEALISAIDDALKENVDVWTEDAWGGEKTLTNVADAKRWFGL